MGRLAQWLSEKEFFIWYPLAFWLISVFTTLVGVPKARADRLTVPAGGWFNLENAFAPDRFDRVKTEAMAGAVRSLIGPALGL